MLGLASIIMYTLMYFSRFLDELLILYILQRTCAYGGERDGTKFEED